MLTYEETVERVAQAGQPGGCSQGKNFGSWSSRHGSEKVANSGNMLRVRQAGLADKLHVVKHLPTMWETQFQSLGGKIPWRRKWHPIPVFLPGKSHGQRSLVCYTVHGVARVRCNLVTPSSLMGPLCIFFWCMEKFGSCPFIKELSIICLFFHSFTHSFLLEIFMVSTLMPGTLLGARIPRHTQGPHLCLLSAEELTRKLPILLHRWTDLTKSSPFPHF